MIDPAPRQKKPDDYIAIVLTREEWVALLAPGRWTLTGERGAEIYKAAHESARRQFKER